MNDQVRTDIEIIGSENSPAYMSRVRINGTEVDASAITVNGSTARGLAGLGNQAVTVSLDLTPSSLRFGSSKTTRAAAGAEADAGGVMDPVNGSNEDFLHDVHAHLYGDIEAEPVPPAAARRLHALAQTAMDELASLQAALDEGEASDGYHTHRELYDFRALYHAHAVRYWIDQGYQVVKSRRHADGEPPFGGGWFIVSAMLPSTPLIPDRLQITNHYPDESWDLFDVPEVDMAPEWDGHDSKVAAARLRLALGTDRPVLPETDTNESKETDG